MEEEFYREFIPAIAKRHRIKSLIPDVPCYVDVASRISDKYRYIFIQNYGTKEEKVKLPSGCEVLMGSEDGILPPVSTTIVRVEL